ARQRFAFDHHQRPNALRGHFLESLENRLIRRDRRRTPALLIEQRSNSIAQFHNTPVRSILIRIGRFVQANSVLRFFFTLQKRGGPVKTRPFRSTAWIETTCSRSACRKSCAGRSTPTPGSTPATGSASACRGPGCASKHPAPR